MKKRRILFILFSLFLFIATLFFVFIFIMSRLGHLPPEVKRLTSSCESNSLPVFTHHITDIAAITDVQAPPRMVGEYLKTHSYIGTGATRVPVYAPVDMTLSDGAYYQEGDQLANYTFTFDVSCEVRLRYDHVTEPVDSIVAIFPNEPQSHTRSQPLLSNDKPSFSAGELIGYTTRTEYGNWDFGVYNLDIQNRFADDPEFDDSFVYTSAVCPFDYFTEELKQEYYNLFSVGPAGDDQIVLDSFCS